MKRSMTIGSKHINTILFSLLLCAFAHAQVSVRSNINRDNILIGEPVSLTVEAYVPLGAAVLWFPSDTIPHFEISTKSPVDTTPNIDGKKITQSFSITSFDSGQQYIPPFEITVDGQQYYTDSVLINVSYTPFDPQEDYRDIKDIIEISNPSAKYVNWVILAAAILALAVTILLWLKRKYKKPVEKKPAVPLLSPYDEAMKALAGLSRRTLNNGEVKIFYSDMNDILRKYVSRKFTVSTFERTNEELILELSRHGIPKDAFISLVQSLRMSDIVKFAKYHPSDDDNKENLKIVSTSIEILEKNTEGAV